MIHHLQNDRYPIYRTGTGYQVSGTWYLGPDTWYRIDAECRIPNAEDRRPSLALGEPAHGRCILCPASIS